MRTYILKHNITNWLSNDNDWNEAYISHHSNSCCILSSWRYKTYQARKDLIFLCTGHSVGFDRLFFLPWFIQNDGNSSHLVIDTPNLTDHYMIRSIRGKIERGERIEEVWLKDRDGKLHLLYKNTNGWQMPALASEESVVISYGILDANIQ